MWKIGTTVGGRSRMGRPRMVVGSFFLIIFISVEYYGLIPQFTSQSSVIIFLLSSGMCATVSSSAFRSWTRLLFWKSLIFLGLLTTLLLIIHSYFNFVFWHLYHLVIFGFFDYFILVNWHHLLLYKQDKQHTVTLACSMFIIHVPFCVKFSTFLRGDLFFYLCVSWGRAPTRLEFPRRLPLSRCRAGEWPDDKFISISRALLSLSNVVP